MTKRDFLRFTDASNKKINSGSITLAAMLVCSVIMPLLIVGNDKYLFFGLYLIFSVSVIICSK
jgi:hypothetical protein